MGEAVTMDLSSVGLDLSTAVRIDHLRSGISIPANHELLISIADWGNLDPSSVFDTTLPL